MLLEACGVRAGYDSRDILAGVDFRLSGGEMVGLLGSNGSGKSTLLRALTRVLPLRAGTVTLDGEPMDRMSRRDIARKIAFVPQQEPTTFDFSVRDVVLMGRFPHRSPNAPDREEDFRIVARALAEVDALQLANRPSPNSPAASIGGYCLRARLRSRLRSYSWTSRRRIST